MALAVDALPLLDDKRAPTAKDDRCGCGCLIVTRESRRFTLPLRAVSFSAQVAERVAEVTVEQTFENTYAELLEAVYIFPLPGGAAVSRFELHVDGKKLVGIVEERGEARRQYDQAIAQGKKAALLEQERDDVFTVKVGNLPPRSIATVKMVYSERLPAFDDGETELRVPLVVAPRYIPGQPLERASLGDGTESDTTNVPDASRISPPRLAPGLRGDIKLSISVDLLGSDAVDELGCTQHATKLAGSGGKTTITLAKKDELLDRDFVLRWRTAAAQEKPFLLVAKKGGECYGLLSLVPPRDVHEGQGARDVVFLLDRSGSMSGQKMESAKRAVQRLLGTLQPHDRFALCAFSDRQEWFQDGLMAADAGGRHGAQQWLARCHADGGTELDHALDACFKVLEESSNVITAGGMKKVKPQVNRLPVLVLVTDGEVGNESEILRRVEGRLANVRVFTLGIDTAVNAAFLRRLAQLGRGTSALCAPGADLEDALARIGREIGTPVLLDIEVEDRGLGFDPASITPERLPDLFAGRTASIFFKCRSAKGALRIKAKRAEGGTFEQLVNAEVVELAALSQLWAKSRISDLEDRYRLAYGGAGGGLEASRAEILGLALEHQLLTRFTAFIVIDHSEVAERLAKRKIVQAVETPAGWGDQKQEATKDSFKRSMAPPPMRTAAMPAAAMPADDMEFGAALEADPFGAVDGAPMTASAIDPNTLGDPFGMPGGAFGGGLGGDPFASGRRSGSAPPPPPAAGPAAPAASFRMPSPKKSPPPPVGGKADKRKLDESGAREGASVPKEREKAPDRPVVKGGLIRSKSAVPHPQRPLSFVLDELGKELAAALRELEAGRWVADGGQLIDELRLEVLANLEQQGLDAKARRTMAFLEQTLPAVVKSLAARKGKPLDQVNSVRAATEALAAQCRSELAPLLGQGGSPWEASI